MTPYVLNTPEKAYAETARRHGYITESSNLWTKGWSDSSLAVPPDAAHSRNARQMDKDVSAEYQNPDEPEVVPVSQADAPGADAAEDGDQPLLDSSETTNSIEIKLYPEE